MARRSHWWWKYQNRINASRLVFIDETWTKTNMAPPVTPRSKRLNACSPQDHLKALTVLAALREDTINSPCVFDGPVSGENFILPIEQLLTTLKDLLR